MPGQPAEIPTAVTDTVEEPLTRTSRAARKAVPEAKGLTATPGQTRDIPEETAANIQDGKVPESVLINIKEKPLIRGRVHKFVYASFSHGTENRKDVCLLGLRKAEAVSPVRT